MNKWLLMLALLAIVGVAVFLVWSSGGTPAGGHGASAPPAAGKSLPSPVRDRAPAISPTA